jgi:hypothetical protein
MAQQTMRSMGMRSDMPYFPSEEIRLLLFVAEPDFHAKLIRYVTYCTLVN